MGCGRLPGWTATIHPFPARPDVGVPIVLYAVPPLNPDGPASPFVDRFWDAREGFSLLGIGLDPASVRPYFGPRPDGTVAPLVGSADQWLNGLSYTLWAAGGYSNPNGCFAVPGISTEAKVHQAQTVSVPLARGLVELDQVQAAWTGTGPPIAASAEAQAVWTGSVAELDQVHAIWQGSSGPAAEAQAVWTGSLVELDQVETVPQGSVAELNQVQGIPGYWYPKELVFEGTTTLSPSPPLRLYGQAPNLVGRGVSGPGLQHNNTVTAQTGNDLTTNPAPQGLGSGLYTFT